MDTIPWAATGAPPPNSANASPSTDPPKERPGLDRKGKCMMTPSEVARVHPPRIEMTRTAARASLPGRRETRDPRAAEAATGGQGREKAIRFSSQAAKVRDGSRVVNSSVERRKSAPRGGAGAVGADARG